MKINIQHWNGTCLQWFLWQNLIVCVFWVFWWVVLSIGIEKEQLARGFSNLDICGRKKNCLKLTSFFFLRQEDLRAKPKLHRLLYDIQIQMVRLAYLYSGICTYWAPEHDFGTYPAIFCRFTWWTLACVSTNSDFSRASGDVLFYFKTHTRYFHPSHTKIGRSPGSKVAEVNW